MELLVTLSKPERLVRLAKERIDGIICGSMFSSRFSYSLGEMERICEQCRSYGLKFYVSIDDMIPESKKDIFFQYMERVCDLNVDGIYFQDLGLVDVAETFHMSSKLIYDPGPMVANSLDTAFYLSNGLDVVLARELTMDEDLDIIARYPRALDMQLFGHLRMSMSKRRFLTNYFSFLERDYDPEYRDDLMIQEEQRTDLYPITEDENGTRIYTDFILECYEEYPFLKRLLKRGIIDDQFIDEEILIQVIKDLGRVSENNVEFLENNLLKRFPEKPFGSGYFYQKTNKTKENE